MPELLPPIAMLGVGSMGGAILTGLARHGAERIVVTNRTAAKAGAIGHEGVESIALESEPGGNARAVAGAKLVVLGVKPAGIVELARDIAPHLEADAVVVSIAAGTTTASIETVLPASVAVVRAMPNTPSHVGLGVTGVAGGSRAAADDVALVARLFESVGEVLVLDESQIDALSTISGSGPAYVFLLIEELTRTAERMGFTREQAATMVQGTFRGASELLAADGAEPAELRRRVTSPKGTTERAVAVLQEARLGEVFDRATAAALERARELAAG
ncbi:pyrroline-5-carboxylate reductase [Agrococcus sp. Marseille-Q4369]|uniref:pyrroline-5-carboxylate reductase n=1 Tax=Agrococcus sp. Marseille-Q4369 TaxID=2810513 RepID=UPI001B8AE303|nr:pyrroline-5-carboxylate reductase [Agrococcus sp. Marseille-Q4369]QUW18386.1 pyrroline-5-carboxylate reductase [Agrococcus sp. Marseille-Q4369]